MAGFVVGVQELIDGEWWLYVETTADVVGCAACGIRAVGHGRAPTAVRDLPIAGRPTVLVWAKRRWRCPEAGCEVDTWVETCELIAPRASLTERARVRLAAMVNVEGDSIAAAAAEFGVRWHTANAAVAQHTDPHVEDPARFEAIGVDEKRFTNATPEHPTTFRSRDSGRSRDRLLAHPGQLNRSLTELRRVCTRHLDNPGHHQASHLAPSAPSGG